MDVTIHRRDDDGWATGEEVVVEVYSDEDARIWTPYGYVEACKILTEAEMRELEDAIDYELRNGRVT